MIALVVGVFLVTGVMGAPYVPTEKQHLENVFTKLYRLNKKDVLVDFGAGDGVVLEAASRRGAKAIGIELNPLIVLAAKWRHRRDSRIQMHCGNMFHYRLPKDVTVVYVYANVYIIKSIYERLQKESLRLGKSIYLISNAFDLPKVKCIKKVGQHYLYKVMPKATEGV